MTPEQKAAIKTNALSGHPINAINVLALLADLEAAEARGVELERQVNAWVTSSLALEHERNEAREKLAASDSRVKVLEAESVQWLTEHLADNERLFEIRDKLAASELAMAGIREAVEKEPHSDICKYFVDNFRRAGIKGLTRKDCSCIKSRIPTDPDSALVEAVKRIVHDFSGPRALILTVMMERLVALAPDSWKQPEGGKL